MRQGVPAAPPAPADLFIRLACLDYETWRPGHPASALRLLAERPGIARDNIFCAAAAGDVAAVRVLIDRDAALVNTRGGPLRGATVADAVEVAWLAEAATESLHKNAPVRVEEVRNR